MISIINSKIKRPRLATQNRQACRGLQRGLFGLFQPDFENSPFGVESKFLLVLTVSHTSSTKDMIQKLRLLFNNSSIIGGIHSYNPKVSITALTQSIYKRGLCLQHRQFSLSTRLLSLLSKKVVVSQRCLC